VRPTPCPRWTEADSPFATYVAVDPGGLARSLPGLTIVARPSSRRWVIRRAFETPPPSVPTPGWRHAPLRPGTPTTRVRPCRRPATRSCERRRSIAPRTPPGSKEPELARIRFTQTTRARQEPHGRTVRRRRRARRTGLRSDAPGHSLNRARHRRSGGRSDGRQGDRLRAIERDRGRPRPASEHEVGKARVITETCGCAT
jgi:hypothetical protein